MQGTLFSSDYVVDANGNERLIEINTDTAFTDDFIDNYQLTLFLPKPLGLNRKKKLFLLRDGEKDTTL